MGKPWSDISKPLPKDFMVLLANGQKMSKWISPGGSHMSKNLSHFC